MYGHGITGAETTDAFKFALGDVNAFEYETYDAMWSDIVSELEAGRPIAAANSHHGFVITGYDVKAGHRRIMVNDPWPGRNYPEDLDRTTLPASDLTLWLMPANPTVRQQEPSVIADSDGDGVIDFDETERFRTNPNDADGDADKLGDKQDIVTGVFDPQYGYATTGRNPLGRDYDSDGIPTERDKDSDEGGCLDGIEDANGNGHRDQPERYNFDGDDDRKDECQSDVIRLHGTFTGHGEDSLSTSDATFDLTILWYNPRDIHEPLAFQFESASFTFSTNVIGVCAGSLSEGTRLEIDDENVQWLQYGDPAEGKRDASAQVFDERVDGGGVKFALSAYFILPGNGDPSCEPPYEPYGYVPMCPLVFLPVPAATQDGRPTLQADASCDVGIGTTWTGHLVEQ